MAFNHQKSLQQTDQNGLYLDSENEFCFIIQTVSEHQQYFTIMPAPPKGSAVASWLVHCDACLQIEWSRLEPWPLSTQVCKWASVNLMLGVTLRWTICNIKSRVKQKYFQWLHPTETRINSGLIGHLPCVQNFPNLTLVVLLTDTVGYILIGCYVMRNSVCT